MTIRNFSTQFFIKVEEEEEEKEKNAFTKMKKEAYFVALIVGKMSQIFIYITETK